MCLTGFEPVTNDLKDRYSDQTELQTQSHIQVRLKNSKCLVLELCENHVYSHITNMKIVTFSYCVPIRQENFQKIRSNNLFRLCYSFQNGTPFSICKYYMHLKANKDRLIIPIADCLSDNPHVSSIGLETA